MEFNRDRKNPLISVIIPLFNKEAIIERTIQSVLCQSFQDFELIIVNDGSTDGSMDVVRTINDDRIVLIEQENGGPGKARNTGVEHSHGEWILFLDADDELVKDALEHLYGLTIAFPEVNIVDGSYAFASSGKVHKTIVRDKAIVKNAYKAFFYRDVYPSTGHTLFKTTLIKQNPYNENLRRYEDVELVMRLLLESTIVTTSKIIFYINGKYSSASTARQHIDEDFLGHLVFAGKKGWEKMCLFQFYIWERNSYPDAIDNLYPSLKWRVDLWILYKFLLFLRRINIL